MRFEDALAAVYRDNPCAVLPNALWKTVSVLNQYETAVGVKNGNVVYLKAWNKDRLLVYWTKERTTFDLPRVYVDEVTFMLLHQDYSKCVPLQQFHHSQYFRMIHKGTVAPYSLPSRFCVNPVDIDADVEAVSAVINCCYDTIRLSPETVKTWINHPVFDEQLWIWMYDKARRTPAGLGIAEVDKTVPEASLEWIQVLPAYRGKGLGKALVLELLKRVCKKVEFTTVSGETTGYANQFYKSCGFIGDNMWWVLTR